MPQLSIAVPGFAERIRRFEHGPFVIGRDEQANETLDFPFISRRHVVIDREGTSWVLEATGRNAVRVDGQVVERTALEDGARIEMGPVVIVFDSAGSPDRTVAPTMELTREQALALAEPRLARLGELCTRLSTVGSVKSALSLVTSAILDACRASSVEVWTSEPRPLERRISRLDEPTARAIVKKAIERDGIVTYDRIGASVEMPIVAAAGDERGYVLVATRDDPTPFGKPDIAFVMVVARLFEAAANQAKKTEGLAADRDRLKREVEQKGGFGSIVGSSAPIVQLGEAIAKVAPTDTTALVFGETGAGKELVARELHARSRRSDGPFVAINCAALPETLIESELFGHRRGAFSGADQDRDGLFVTASTGTLFLDEVGELPLAAQAKLLRALESREVHPLGAPVPVPIDVRLVAATHRDLAAAVEAQTFREDLYFRLKVFVLRVPALRDRIDDVPELVRTFLERNATFAQKRLQAPTPAFFQVLSGYEFPGNVRELLHVIEHAVIMADDGEALDAAHLSLDVGAAPAAPSSVAQPTHDRALRDIMAEHERAVILAQLERDGWNRTKAAKNLQVSLRGFMQKLKRYEIKGPSPSR